MQRTSTNSSTSARGPKYLHGRVPLLPEATCTYSPLPCTHRSIAYTSYSEKYVEVLANWLAKIYIVLSRIPKWIFLVASGSIGSLLIQAMHSWGKKKERKPKRRVVKSPPATDTKASAGASPAKTRSEGSPSGGRRRRNARR